VIATTSTAEKAERLKARGASEVINYTETPDWDAKERELADGRGVDCVVEIGGPSTIDQLGRGAPMTSDTSPRPVSPLRARMIEDMRSASREDGDVAAVAVPYEWKIARTISASLPMTTSLQSSAR
jgi:threonine dehydrogenase-like Zn-dependent dehydrogenase